MVVSTAAGNDRDPVTAGCEFLGHLGQVLAGCHNVRIERLIQEQETHALEKQKVVKQKTIRNLNSET